MSERRLADHAPGSALQPSVAVTSSAAANGVRTVTLTRPVAGGNYSLPTAPGDLSLITAVGSTPTLAYAAADPDPLPYSGSLGSVPLPHSLLRQCLPCAPIRHLHPQGIVYRSKELIALHCGANSQ